MNVPRHIPRIALFLLAGVVLSYSAAWAIEYHASSRWWWSEEGHVITSAGGVAWPLSPRAWPATPTPDLPDSVPEATIINDALGRQILIASSADRSLNLWSAKEIRDGWPLACCVRFELEFWPAPGQPRTPAVAMSNPWISGVHVTDVQSPDGPIELPVVLPIKPRWTGLAVNSIFYSVLFASGAWMAGWAVRANRRRRGLCDVCKYPRGASAVCTECGRRVA